MEQMSDKGLVIHSCELLNKTSFSIKVWGNSLPPLTLTDPQENLSLMALFNLGLFTEPTS